jgi:hypothetical protein
VQLFKQDFKARYSGGVISTFQDASIAPVGTLIDQSEVVAKKWGLRSSWVRPDLGLQGLELTTGLDLLDDTSSSASRRPAAPGCRRCTTAASRRSRSWNTSSAR